MEEIDIKYEPFLADSSELTDPSVAVEKYDAPCNEVALPTPFEEIIVKPDFFEETDPLFVAKNYETPYKKVELSTAFDGITVKKEPIESETLHPIEEVFLDTYNVKVEASALTTSQLDDFDPLKTTKPDPDPLELTAPLQPTSNPRSIFACAACGKSFCNNQRLQLHLLECRTHLKADRNSIPVLRQMQPAKRAPTTQTSTLLSSSACSCPARCSCPKCRRLSIPAKPPRRLEDLQKVVDCILKNRIIHCPNPIEAVTFPCHCGLAFATAFLLRAHDRTAHRTLGGGTVTAADDADRQSGTEKMKSVESNRLGSTLQTDGPPTDAAATADLISNRENTRLRDTAKYDGNVLSVRNECRKETSAAVRSRGQIVKGTATNVEKRTGGAASGAVVDNRAKNVDALSKVTRLGSVTLEAVKRQYVPRAVPISAATPRSSLSTEPRKIQGPSNYKLKNSHEATLAQLAYKAPKPVPKSVQQQVIFIGLEGSLGSMMVTAEDPSNIGQTLYLCNICDAWFGGNAQLLAHMGEKHTPKGTVPCGRCNQLFMTAQQVECHVAYAHKKDIRAEQEAAAAAAEKKRLFELLGAAGNKVFEMKQKAERRNRIYGNLLPFRCRTCDVGFSAHEKLAQHNAKQHAGVPLRCSACQRLYHTQRGLSAHKRKCGKWPARLLCPECPKLFAHSAALKKHRYLSHSNERPFECEACKKRFNDMYNLRFHIKTIHDGERKHYPCPKCSKIFTALNSVRMHDITAHQPVKCKLCDESVIGNATLRVHILDFHSAATANKFACAMCGQSFGVKNSLQNHLFSKHGVGESVGPLPPPPPPKELIFCDVCRKAYLVKTSLERHLASKHGFVRLQDGEVAAAAAGKRKAATAGKRKAAAAEFPCGACGRRYVRGANLAKHVAKEHATGAVV